MASEECRSLRGASRSRYIRHAGATQDRDSAGRRGRRQGRGCRKPQPDRTDSGTVMRLSIDELTFLAPRLRGLSENPAPGWPRDRRCRRFSARRTRRLEIALGRGLHRHGPRAGGDRDRHRLGETGGAFPLDARRVFPRHGGEGQGGRAQSRAHSLGLAPSEIAQFASAWQGRGHMTGAADLERPPTRSRPKN